MSDFPEGVLKVTESGSARSSWFAETSRETWVCNDVSRTPVAADWQHSRTSPGKVIFQEERNAPP